ncbi:MAG: hypothetical protein ACXU82_10690 [Caulobacteraceae bacterium]
MKLFSTWTGVLIVVLLAVAMGGVAVYQYVHALRPTALASVAGLVIVAVILARRVARKK